LSEDCAVGDLLTRPLPASPDLDTFMKHFNRNIRPHVPIQRDRFEETEAQKRKEAAN
jgi:hypothetical protein